MSEREEIRRRVEQFRKLQQRLCAERDARMNKTTQQIRSGLSELYRDGATIPSRLQNVQVHKP